MLYYGEEVICILAHCPNVGTIEGFYISQASSSVRSRNVDKTPLLTIPMLHQHTRAVLVAY